MTLILDREPTNTDLFEPAVTASPADVENLIREHLPLVGHLVREVLNRVPAHVNRDDLTSAGMYALTSSAKSFDPAFGVPFPRFASIRIRGALTDELRTMDWASRAVRGKARELNIVRSELTHTIGAEPTRSEIADAMGISVADLSTLESDVQRAGLVSLQALPSEDGAATVPSTDDQPEETLIKREQIGYLRDAIVELPAKLRLVIEEYFFGQRRMADIAAELGVTESRVSQLRSEALVMLRSAMAGMDDGKTDAASAPARGRAAAAKQAYVAAVATRSTLASRLSATTLLGETRSSDNGEYRVAN
ncbi:MAG TPA: sigma-70 family RNA polymerase sigma factor [Jatrophihabitans sp.]|jgi:RNA polymerase sigma factor for flagellar operon FliA